MADLGRRLRLLEASGGGECPECGFVPGEPVEDLAVTWHDTEEAEPVEPEWCPRCGEQTVYVVTWRDLQPEDPGEGGR